MSLPDCPHRSIRQRCKITLGWEDNRKHIPCAEVLYEEQCPEEWR